MIQAGAPDSLKQFMQISAASGYAYPRLAWRMQNLFDGVEWRGKHICEIGCGEGLMSLYLALLGAEFVVGVDPEAKGSKRGRVERLKVHTETLGLENFKYVPAFFEAEHLAPHRFDVIFSVNVIEHIRETRKPLRRDPEAYRAYEQFFGEMFNMLNPGGVAIVANCSRYSVWALLSEWTDYRVRTPIAGMRHVCWPLHQAPETWARLAREAGFSQTRIHWRVPFELRSVSWLVDNAIVQYFTFADYTVKAWKQG